MSQQITDFTKKDQIEHMLLRPDMYVGSARFRKSEEYIVDKEFKISKKEISVSPAILRIFIEPLSNMFDNWGRSKGKNKVTEMRVTIDKNTGETSFWNDGLAIPIEKHKQEKCYIHTMIFGELLSGSNFNDDEQRENISGRNGVGIKATNIYSTEFMVEGVDPKRKKYFKQVWTNNMRKPQKPIVLKTEEKRGYTKITFTPDFTWFSEKSGKKIEKYSKDLISVYKKLLMDTAMMTKVDCFFNDKKIPVSSLKEYATFFGTKDDNSLYIKTKECEVVVMESKEFEVISYVNGIITPEGGTHVDPWIEALFRPLLEKVNKKGRPSVNIRDIKQFFRIFVVATVINPEFKGQEKVKLESPSVEAEVKKTHISTIAKWPVIDRLEEIIRAKELGSLKKIERKRNCVKVDSLDSANNEGGSRSTECTLILVEGLSAKTYATYGITHGVFGKKGRDWFGIYALRGKLLNCRNASMSTIAKNNVVGDIIKALGIKVSTDYTLEENYKKLRYGKVMVITDQDTDGIHISGLIQNIFHSLFPTLLQREEPFLTSMQTPIVRVYLNSTKTKSKLFYSENQFRKWFGKNPEKAKEIKYYKGLGTNNEDDIDESFGKKMVKFTLDDEASTTMNKAFHKNYTDLRKDWLAKYDCNNTVLKWKGNEEEVLNLSISDFIDTELIHFSHDNCKRSIPSLIDGFKEGHRKVLYACFLRNLKHSGKTLKVAQLAGYVAEKSAYHHGEGNLYDTITGMANAYIGSNNIPLLFRDGQYGSRLSGGKDAANGRYIFTKLDALTRLIFRSEDDVILNYRQEEGEKIEPYFYVPIIPMILVNGTTCGIGTGWSSNVPCYNPIDLITCVKLWLESKDTKNFPELFPWYRSHTGEMTVSKTKGKFISHGRVKEEGTKLVIEELPVGVWTDKYKEHLDALKEKKLIKSFKNHSTVKEVKFTITGGDEDCLKLTNNINTSNMCLFDDEETLKKYNTSEEIIDSFCKVRLLYYAKRKKHLLNELEKKIKMLGNKKRFLKEVLKGTFTLFEEKNGKRQSRKITDMYKELEDKGYDKEEGKGDYDYLLRLQFRSITEENIEKLKNDIASSIKEKDILADTKEDDIWIKELDEFQEAYLKWLKVIEKEKVKKRKKK